MFQNNLFISYYMRFFQIIFEFVITFPYMETDTELKYRSEISHRELLSTYSDISDMNVAMTQRFFI